MTQPWIDQRLTSAELDAIQAKALSATHYATMVKYDHGGARIGVFEGDEHQLVADIYSEVDRNFFEVATPETVLRLVEQARPMKWQPIETAPTGGTRILLWWRSCIYPSIGSYELDEQFNSRPRGWRAPEEGWRNIGDQCIPRNQEDCTHWMPLPKPPEAK